MFIIAPFIIAICNQLKYPSSDEWVKNIEHIHTMDYYLAIKRTKSCHVQQNGWARRTSNRIRHKKTNTTCSVSCAEAKRTRPEQWNSNYSMQGSVVGDTV